MQADLGQQITSIETWSVENPTKSVPFALVLSGAGAALVATAVAISGLRLGLLGITTASIGLLLLNDRVRAATLAHRARAVVGAGIAVVVAALLVWQGFAHDSLVLGAVGAVVGMIAVLPIGALVREQADKAPTWLTFAGLGVVGLGLIMLSFATLRLYGAVVIVVGLPVYKAGLRNACAAESSALVAATTGGAAVALGLFVVWAGSDAGRVTASVAGIVAVICGLMAASEGWPALGLRPFSKTWVRILGAVLWAVTAILVVWLTPYPWFAMAIGAIVVGLLGASIVWRGDGVVAIGLVTLAVAWLLIDRTDDRAPDPNPTAPSRILAVGDSYMSGEGAPTFLRGTNVKGGHTNECRRAPKAYPRLLALRLHMGLDFFACSGAISSEIWSTGQMPDSAPNVVGAKAQLDNPFDPDRVGVVLVSIGGNNAKFGDIGKGCVVPGSCDALRGLWSANLDSIVPDVVTAYTKIKEAVHDKAPVIVVPYPHLLKDQHCEWSALAPSEHVFLSNFVTLLDERVRLAAARAGVWFFDPGLFAFKGKEICDGHSANDTAMNFISINPVEGTFVNRISPRNWIHGSLHPKPEGHELIADRLGPFITQLRADIAAGTKPVNPPPDLDATADDLGQSGIQTVLFAPDQLPHASKLPCVAASQVSPFATSVQLFGENIRVALDADPAQPVCATAHDGSWVETSARERSGVVRITPDAPDKGAGDTQYVVYFEPTRGWRLRLLRFCSRDPNCPNDSSAWTNAQLAQAARAAAPPLLALVFAGWLFALGGTRRSQG